METPWLDFDAPPSLPVSGKTPESRDASRSGARFASLSRKRLTADYLDLLRSHGPLTDQDAAVRLTCGLSSINSVRAGIQKSATKTGINVVAHQVVAIRRAGWPTRYRTQWSLKSA